VRRSTLVSTLAATTLAGLLTVGMAAAEIPPDLVLALVTDELVQPVGLATAGDDRLFVIERAGRVRVVRHGALLPTPFLDLRAIVDSEDGEQGLLGLAFHPRHAENGYLYVAYTRDLVPRQPHRHEKVIARYQVTADPGVADPTTATMVAVIPQPFENHNGGDLHFGLDGYLWIATGDGGGAGDPFDNAQNRASLLGKILRVDVDRDDFPADPERNYGIPPDNPFVDGPGAPEVWALGLRNPWRFSVDRRTCDVFVADVGQALFEEVNLLPAGVGGLDLGWDCWEGTSRFLAGGNPACPAPEAVTWPILEYRHGQGDCAVTGGYRYRGHVIAGIAGRYLFGDFCSGRLWLADQRPGGWATTLWRQAGNVSAFGQDARGELYVVDYRGRLLRVTSPSSVFFEDFEGGDLGAWTRVVAGTPPDTP
jgi:hypothetical protein